jgi:hypothetical protein
MGELIPLDPGRLFTVKKPLGMEGMSARELGIDIPMLKLIHSIRSANDIGRPGQWKLNSQLWDSVPVIVLKGHHIRTLLEGPDDRPRTVCASSDGRTPHDQVPEPRAEQCPTCPYSQWKDGAAGKRIPPKCGDGLALLVLILQAAPGSPLNVQPAWALFRKGARLKASELGKALVDHGAQTFSDYVVHMASEEKRNQGVIWYEPRFTIGEATTEYRRIVAYVEEQQICYTPFVIGTTIESATEPPVDEAAGWDVPV